MTFASELNIPPWDIGRLSVAEFRQAIHAFEEMEKERAKGR